MSKRNSSMPKEQVQEVTGIRLMDMDEFREQVARDTAWLARLDAMEAQP